MTQTWDKAWGTGWRDHEILARTSASPVDSVLQLSDAGSGKWLIISSVCCDYTLWSVAASQPSHPKLVVTLLASKLSSAAFSPGSFLLSADTCVDKETPEQSKSRLWCWKFSADDPQVLPGCWVLSEGLSFPSRLQVSCPHFPLQ